MKYIHLVCIILLSFLATSIAAKDLKECDEVLVLGFNEFNLQTDIQIREAFYTMLNMSEEQLDESANKYESGDSLSGVYKAISATWSKNRKSDSFLKQYRESKLKHESGTVVNDEFFEFLKIKTVNNETLAAWQQCKEDYFNYLIQKEGVKVKIGGFISRVIGDEGSVFAFVIEKVPQQGQPPEVKITGVTRSNLEFIGDRNIRQGASIENYTGISQLMRLKDPSQKATLVVRIEGFSPITKEFTKYALSSFPVGSIITSVLDFNQFSKEMNNNPDGYFNPETSLWAPADGRSLMGSYYQKNYNDMAPDLRGQFLRGFNQFYSSGESSSYANNRDNGLRRDLHNYSYQSQGTSLPSGSRPFKTASKNIKDRYIANLTAGNYKSTNHQFNNATPGVPENGWSGWAETGEGGDGGNQYAAKIKGETTEVNLEQPIVGGDTETRPQNIAVYYYIRINK